MTRALAAALCGWLAGIALAYVVLSYADIDQEM